MLWARVVDELSLDVAVAGRHSASHVHVLHEEIEITPSGRKEPRALTTEERALDPRPETREI